MKDQVVRILKMVQEGRLSPEDAFDLMDAFIDFEGASRETSRDTTKEEPTAGEKAQDAQASGADGKAESFRALLDVMEKVRREISESIHWHDVAEQVREAAHKGVDALKGTVERIGKGGLHWFGPVETKTVEMPLNIKPGTTLKVERFHGDVKVLGGSQEPKLTATVTVRGSTQEDARNKAANWTPIVEEADGYVSLKQSADSVSENLEILVPEGVAVEIKAESGDVTVKETKAGVWVKALAGDIVVERAKGRVEVHSHAGDISLTRLEGGDIEIENRAGDVSLHEVSGNVKVRSAAGDIKATEMKLATANIETVSGDVMVDIAEPISTDVVIRSVSGDVLLDVDPQSDCRVALSSVSGSVNTSISLEDLAHSRERITGRMGEGAGSVEVSTVSGAVNLHLRD